MLKFIYRFVCENCGSVLDLDMRKFAGSDVAARMARRRGWSVFKDRTEYDSICPNCQKV